jgi:hypothetical protein
VGHRLNAPLDLGLKSLADKLPPPDPAEMRCRLIELGSPAEKAEFTKQTAINVPKLLLAKDYTSALFDRVGATRSPGGLWLFGEGGTGKTFIFESLIKANRPSDSLVRRTVPLLYLPLAGRPAIRDMLIGLFVQLGQHPEAFGRITNDALERDLLEALVVCGTKGVLIDEAHHIYLSATTRRVDRYGGVLGDFIKRFYDRSEIAFVFAGSAGLEAAYENDRQLSTRWSGRIHLHPFRYDDEFIAVLNALDELVPLPERCGFGSGALPEQLFEACAGSFRTLKALVSSAVYIAAGEDAHRIHKRHLQRAYFLTFCKTDGPFK